MFFSTSSVANDPDDLQETRLNMLIMKCINFRKKISMMDLSSVPDFQDDELTLKDKIFSKYMHLEKQTFDPNIEINLYIEKMSESCDKPLPFLCNPKWTVYTTKEKLKDQSIINASLKNMLIVCQNEIAADWKTLKQCGISHDGDILYVYIVQDQSQEIVNNDNSDSFNKEIDELLKKLNSSYTECNTIDQKSFYKTSNQTEVVKDKDSKNNSLQIQPELLFPSSDDYEDVSDTMQPPSICSEVDDCLLNNKPENLQPLLVNIKSVEETPSQTEFLGWKCTKCTYINEPTRPGCLICSNPCPDDYEAPENYTPSTSEVERLNKEKYSEIMTLKMQDELKMTEEQNRLKNYQNYLSAHEQSILENSEPVDCSICLTEVDIGDAVTLSECLHVFCKDCLCMHIMLCDQFPVTCPFVEDTYNCTSSILEREIKALLPDDKFQAYLRKCLGTAEMHIKNSFHCRTADCYGWCEYDDGVNVFECPVCKKCNCLTCKAIHENMNCKEYQEKLFAETPTNKQAKKSQRLLKKLIKKEEAMHCPGCNIIILKKEGCDWLRCSMCGMEICWVTRQPRWGPNGPGDVSGGCGCRKDGKKCHSLCINCH